MTPSSWRWDAPPSTGWRCIECGYPVEPGASLCGLCLRDIALEEQEAAAELERWADDDTGLVLVLKGGRHDPDANLTELLALAAHLTVVLDSEGTVEPDEVSRLVDLVFALDGWVSRKGALPKRWAIGRPAEQLRAIKAKVEAPPSDAAMDYAGGDALFANWLDDINAVVEQRASVSLWDLPDLVMLRDLYDDGAPSAEALEDIAQALEDDGQPDGAALLRGEMP